jgi:hypothetical protein
MLISKLRTGLSTDTGNDCRKASGEKRGREEGKEGRVKGRKKEEIPDSCSFRHGGNNSLEDR